MAAPALSNNGEKMIDPGKKAVDPVEFSPLLGKITNPIQLEIVAFFQENPDEGIDAAGLAGELKREDIPRVEEGLEKLEEAGLLSSEIKGVVQTRHYHYTPEVSLKPVLARLFGGDAEKAFRTYLEKEDSRRTGKRKKLFLAAAILIVLGLGAGVYWLVENVKDSAREEVQEDLSQFTGIHETHYSNGQIKSRIEYVEGRREGSFSAWFENGQKMAEGTYQDQRPQGRWIYWNEKGEPLTMIVYRDGRAVTE